MRMLILSAGLAMILCGSISAQDEPVRIHNGFLTGNEYRGRSGMDRDNYVSGLIDGMLLAPLFGGPKERLGWLERCVVGMTNVQVRTIVDQYLQEHPEVWDEGMHTIAFRAMRRACERKNG